MNDMSSMSRENKKQQLRSRVISSDAPPVRPGAMQEDAEEAARLEQKKARRRRRIFLALLLLLVAAGVGGWFYYRRNYQYTSFETSWQVDLNEGSLVSYEAYGTNILKVTKDGASYMDNKGKPVWTDSYEMKNPTVAVHGDYAVIADRQGNSIYIYNTLGREGEATTILPISKVAISATGVVAAVLEDSTASYVTFYNRDGTSLDITIKTIISGDGYVMDAALSEDGTQLMCSVAYLTNGELKNRVVFYDFSEVGKNIPNRMVGGFDDEFDAAMVPRVTYLSEPYSCAFSVNGMTFFSSKNLASPEMIGQYLVEEEIESVFYSEDYAAMIVRNTSGEYNNRLEVCKSDGSHVLTKEFNYEYTHADIDGDLIILYNEDSCQVFNMAGVQKLYAAFDFTIDCVRQGRFPNTLIVTGPQQMREIRLH
ncbi:MAG: DUF5711 family protein [Clostridiales bacterium]|nr:DUF5711 family protein [Clostridiales bacterium]